MGRIAVVACVLVGCTEETPTAESQHIRLFVDPAQVSCDRKVQDGLNFLESSAVATANFLGVELDGQIDYHWMPDWPGDSPCPDTSLGCESGGDAWGKFPLAHEIVHAVEFRHFGYNAVSFFTEGLAVAIGDYPYPDAVPVTVDFDVVLAQSAIETGDYQRAGELTSYLLAAYGPEKYLAFVGRIERGTSVASVRAAFVAVYGMSLEAMNDQRVASGWSFGGTLAVAACAAFPVLDWNNGVHHSVTFDCEEAPFDAMVDVPETGEYRLDMSSSASATNVDVRNCTFGYGAEAPYAGYGVGSYQRLHETALSHLRKGRYRVSAYAVNGVTASLDLTPDPSTCDTPIVFAADQNELTIHPDAGATRRFSVTAEAPAILKLSFGYYKPAAVGLCSACTGACEPVADNQVLNLQAGQTQIFEVTASETWMSGISLEKH